MQLLDIKNMKQMLSNSRNALIGVSGGVDSMVLLDCIVKNRHKFTTNFRVMYVDHQINSKSSAWGHFVENRCTDYSIPCEVVKVDITSLGNNVEYAARLARYTAFCNANVDSIILAHHANDQFESFLLKFFRGSGIRGLKSMTPSSACWLNDRIIVHRPFLHVTRFNIELYAETNNIQHIEDPSNVDTKYDRNYVRNVIMPTIRERFDIADVNSIKSIQHLNEAWELTKILADQDIESVTNSDLTLDWIKIQNLGYIRAKNLMLRIIEKENIQSFSVNHIENFCKGLMTATMDSRHEMNIKGVVVKKIGKTILIVNSSNQAKLAA